MNDRRDRDLLLKDILAEPGADGLRERLLARTLLGAKRRRLARRVRAAGSALAVIVVVGFVAWRMTLPDLSGPMNQEPSYALVRTRPMPQPAVVETHPLDSENAVASAPSRSVVAFATSGGDPIYTDVDDNTLLSLTAPRPAILVRLGPHSAELVFVPDTNEL